MQSADSRDCIRVLIGPEPDERSATKPTASPLGPGLREGAIIIVNVEPDNRASYRAVA
jgi:hypothetical protein